MLDSFTVHLRAGTSGHVFAMADAVRVDQLMNPQLEDAIACGDPARDAYFTICGPSRSAGGTLYHGGGSPGYFELHPELWAGWREETGAASPERPAPGERPLFGYGVVLDEDLTDGRGAPMGYLRNPYGTDVAISADASDGAPA
jgi:hypothetical protein